MFLFSGILLGFVLVGFRCHRLTYCPRHVTPTGLNPVGVTPTLDRRTSDRPWCLVPDSRRDSLFDILLGSLRCPDRRHTVRFFRGYVKL